MQRDRRHAPDRGRTAQTDPWSQILLALEDPSSCASPPATNRRLATRAPGPARVGGQAGATIRPHTVTFIEQRSSFHVLLSWHDPTRCNYAEQTWRLTRAMQSDVCALSGRAIRRGSFVYTPEPGGNVLPLNADAMILAKALKVWSDRCT
ncbi:DUF3331 domain-containing protein [Paraburkholderia guartelaensis]|uniref:DUF3331 domain-containing protein n=1 Tax=Paraburkholderia guartelaensis TaxID=2546446 RepID=UPI002AB64322|nr:DUF3331 domain-containing protein [Paraburkholderia guartelaensis]